MVSSSVLVSLLVAFHLVHAKLEPRFAPYVDVTREDEFKLVELKQKHGITCVSLAFALGGITGKCEPSWAGQLPIDQKYIIDEIRAYQAAGGQVIISTGGQGGPYIETSCKSAAELLKGYEQVITLTNADHIDIDIEAPVPSDIMNEALAQLQNNHPLMTVSFTLGVMDENYGINVNLGRPVQLERTTLTHLAHLKLGIENVKNAVKHGVDVDIVNAMTMDFINVMPSFGDAVIGVSKKAVEQFKTIWPEKSERELYTMLGITPMIGLNDNLKVFELEHAKKLVEWAKAKGVGHLGFWSIGRDKACAGNKKIVDPGCSGMVQSDYAYTEIFLKFLDPNYRPTLPPSELTTKPSHTGGPTQAGTATTSHIPRSTVTLGPMDCSVRGQSYPDPNDCQKYYVCYEGQPTAEKCGAGTIWDTEKHICNFPRDVNRPECK